ncbi:hypothetical protein [Flavobacterium lacus]|uniref:Uncharacterized protein n=1 Tax=Flavobacterium lacus TaxID=1353778 RepID=A0A328WRM2_9FLAO|nr:hypothetical protein [Flavobacterium lacus]RAR47776.1 hypothetical protein B0I10_10747 [Flavobacterium lacus]
MKEKIGSRYALLIGLPVGLTFSILVLIASLFPPFNFLIFTSGLQGFWHPLIWGGIIPFSFIFLLWYEGKKISNYLITKNILLSSFLFTIKLNFKLFLILFLIFVFSLFLFGFSVVLESQIKSLLIGTITILITFIFATIVTTFSKSLIIVKLTQNKLKNI